MNFEDLAHVIESRVREKLDEPQKNAFVVGESPSAAGSSQRSFSLGAARSEIVEEGGRIRLTYADAAPAPDSFAIAQTSIETISEAIYEHLTQRVP